MKSMVVLFALCAVASAYVPLAQPPHLPAIVLDARGRPLDTAEVINNRALHLQAKALEGGYGGYGIAAPWGGYGLGLGGHGLGLGGHYLGKRSLGHLAHAAPAVSHQSRIDVISSPAVHAVAPLAHAAPVVAHAAPIVGHSGAAVSHQSRVDVISSPAVVSHAAPVAHAVPVVAHAAPVVAHAPAVSHQSRIDVISSPALSHAVATPVLAGSAYGVGHAAIPSYGLAPSYGLGPSLYSEPLLAAW